MRPPRLGALARLPVFLALDGKRAVLAGASAGGGLERRSCCRLPAHTWMSMRSIHAMSCCSLLRMRRAVALRHQSA